MPCITLSSGKTVCFEGNKYPDGGEVAFKKFVQTLPSNLKDSSNYNLRGYWEALGKPTSFNYNQPKESDGKYHAFSRNPNTGEILKSQNHPTFRMALEEDAKVGYLPYSSPNGKTYTFKKDEVPAGFKPFTGAGLTEYITPKFPDGGKTYPPAYTRDPRKVQAYNDSSALYKQGIENEKFFREHGLTKDLTHEFPFSKVTSYAHAKKPKGKIKPISAVSQELNPNHPDYYRAEFLKYEKPVQPYILEEPQRESLEPLQSREVPRLTSNFEMEPRSIDAPFIPQSSNEEYNREYSLRIPTIDINKRQVAPRVNRVLGKNVVNPKNQYQRSIEFGSREVPIIDDYQLNNLMIKMGMEPRFDKGGKTNNDISKLTAPNMQGAFNTFQKQQQQIKQNIANSNGMLPGQTAPPKPTATPTNVYKGQATKPKGPAMTPSVSAVSSTGVARPSASTIQAGLKAKEEDPLGLVAAAKRSDSRKGMSMGERMLQDGLEWVDENPELSAVLAPVIALGAAEVIPGIAAEVAAFEAPAAITEAYELGNSLYKGYQTIDKGVNAAKNLSKGNYAGAAGNIVDLGKSFIPSDKLNKVTDFGLDATSGALSGFGDTGTMEGTLRGTFDNTIADRGAQKIVGNKDSLGRNLIKENIKGAEQSVDPFKFNNGGYIIADKGLKTNTSEWMGNKLDKQGFITSATKGGNRVSFTGDARSDEWINKQIDTGNFGYNPKTGTVVRLDKPVQGLSKEDKIRGTEEFARTTMSGFPSKQQQKEISKLSQEEQDLINKTNQQKRENLVVAENSAALRNPVTYAPGAAFFGGIAAPYIGAGLEAATAALELPAVVGETTLPYVTGSNLLGLAGGVTGANMLSSDLNTGYYSSNAPVMDKVGRGFETGLNILGSPGVPEMIGQGFNVVRNIPELNPFKFKSEIDWAKWNPETPKYKELIDEYNQIEKSSKKAKNWMKNPDGSAFQGTPEQFIQFQSSHFKKAFPEGFEKGYHGSVSHDSEFGMGSLKRKLFLSDKPELANLYAHRNMDNLDKVVDLPLIEFNKPTNPIGYGNRTLYEYGFPKSKNVLTVDAKGQPFKGLEWDDNIATALNLEKKPAYFGKRTANDFNERGAQKFQEISTAPYLSTDDYSEYLSKNPDIDMVKINNIVDLPHFDQTMNNLDRTENIMIVPSKNIKSLRGNVGFFDMNNSNIYRKDGGQTNNTKTIILSTGKVVTIK